jgi:membrane fusion protein (multidrug efflux system)
VAHRVPVKLGFEEAERVEIIEGPEGGEKVVVAGAAALREGSPVEVLGEEPPETPEGEQPEGKQPKRKRPGPHAAG